MGLSPQTGRSERSRLLDALTFELVEGRRQRGSVGKHERGVELEQRHEHEAASREVGVGKGEALVAGFDLPEEEDVDVDRPRSVTAMVGAATKLELDLLADVEERLGLEVGRDLEAGVQEVVLAGGLVLGLGLVGAGGDEHPEARPRVEAGAGRPQGRSAVAHVRAEPEEAAMARPAQAQSARSLKTSTATSSTGSGIGGSGLAARTDTWSTP